MPYKKHAPSKRRRRNLPPKKRYKGQVVIGTAVIGATGKKISRYMHALEAVRQQGRSKGGFAIQASGKAHRWTSESARKAALKSWKVKGRIATRIGVRVGRSHVRPKVRNDRKALRGVYTANIVKNIQYDPVFKNWLDMSDVPRVISERQALTRLGHLKNHKGYIPESILEVRSGLIAAKQKLTDKEQPYFVWRIK